MSLSKVGQSEWKKLCWALKPSMLALIQPKLWEHPDEEVRLTISSCLNRVISLTSPLLPYNNDLMTDILQLIVEALQGLNNIMCPTYQKWCIILKLMAEFRFGTFMLNMECDELIFQLFQIFYTSITSAHSDQVKACMQNIVSLFLKGDADICKILRSKLLTIWKKEPKVSLAAYDLVKKLVKKNIKWLRKVLTKKELRRIDGESKNKICNKNELRRRGLCFIFKGTWALNHSCQ